MIKPLPKSSKNSLSVREKTYSLLKKQILTGQFPPKKKLTEESLAKKFGVSRTPVRDALHKLELEGLVKVAGARGFCVPEDSVEDMSEIFEIRAVLEGHALACVCKIITDKDIQSLKELVQSAEQAFFRGKLEHIFDYNTRFHDLLYGMLVSQKPRLFSIIEDMREYVLRYRKNTLTHPKGIRRSISGHKKILMALELRDPQLCERIMRNHIYEAKEDTILYSK
ncbi:MAG: GntR family transcriptional regulator [Deltaproteobacteria bacterium]|uniref:GntR family transcriptional regulator n=1 Tax=Desulfobacula sp. TaxID=2593537 RepID=UPI0019B2BF3D|nr:GntR family transcriptional regulator [Candidatus Desulfobacula maris]MBL6992465.1 GntR family transcriptional regulator [Desulfobacula sp.]